MGVPQRFGCERARLTSGQQFRATSGCLQHLRCAGQKLGQAAGEWSRGLSFKEKRT
jgi:hypothetical protein